MLANRRRPVEDLIDMYVRPIDSDIEDIYVEHDKLIIIYWCGETHKITKSREQIEEDLGVTSLRFKYIDKDGWYVAYKREI